MESARDTYLPQLYDGETAERFYPRAREFTPHQKLYEALIEGAIQELYNPRKRQSNLGQASIKQWQDDAREWLSDIDSDYIFGFRAACEALGISPSAARKAILSGAVDVRVDRRRKVNHDEDQEDNRAQA